MHVAAWRGLRLQALQVAMATLPVLLQCALLLVAAATVTALVGLPHRGGGHCRTEAKQEDSISNTAYTPPSTY